MFALFVSACSSDPTEVVAGSDDSTEATVEDSGDATESGPDEEATTTTISAVADDSAPVAVGESGTIEPLGDSMIGIGEWAVYRPEMDDDGENECRDGVLAYVVDGAVVHTYDDFSFAGGIRLFNGPRGQDAFAINCEESVEQVLLQGASFLPEVGYPSLVEFRLYGDGAPDAFFEFTGPWLWRGDLFTGAGITAEGQEIYVFDTSDGTIRRWASLVGEPTMFEDPHWVEVVVPEGWSVDDADGYVTVVSDESLSRVQLQRRTTDDYPPLGEGDELLSSDETSVWLEGMGHVAATEWTFLTPDAGVRVVRRVPAEAGTMVEIELFADPMDSGANQDLPWAVLDLIRIWP